MSVLSFTVEVLGTSILAGLLGALTGLGGGVVIVPVQCLLFKVDLHYAIGASLVSVIATSSGAAAAYVREVYSNSRIGMFLGVATTPGALLGTYLPAKVSGNWIDVLNVIQEDAIEHPDRLSELQTRFYGALDEVVPQQAREFCDPRTYVAVGSAHDQIIEHIRERSIDLLVLGIRRTSHISMEMRTSGAFRIIVDAPCPVLTLRS
ncbi:MAG: TSUP family transporter [Terracidiphilus sp.]|jgi:nucleotide-binding universal stress UspA family protein